MCWGHLAPGLWVSYLLSLFLTKNRKTLEDKDKGLIMRVHRKVSLHCCANHVSRHRLKAGHMLGKGQWGYAILIREGFGGGLWIVLPASVSPCTRKVGITLFHSDYLHSRDLLPCRCWLCLCIQHGTFLSLLSSSYTHSSKLLKYMFLASLSSSRFTLIKGLKAHFPIWNFLLCFKCFSLNKSLSGLEFHLQLFLQLPGENCKLFCTCLQYLLFYIKFCHF